VYVYVCAFGGELPPRVPAVVFCPSPSAWGAVERSWACCPPGWCGSFFAGTLVVTAWFLNCALVQQFRYFSMPLHIVFHSFNPLLRIFPLHICAAPAVTSSSQEKDPPRVQVATQLSAVHRGRFHRRHTRHVLHAQRRLGRARRGGIAGTIRYYT
jgi:hypothetical protein